MLDISFKINKNCEPVNRGWQVDCVEAIANNTVIGYIKVSYIPKENYQRFYATALDYQILINGWCVGSDRSKSIKHQIDNKKAIKSLVWYAWSNNDILSRIDTMSLKDLAQVVKSLQKQVYKKQKKSIKNFYSRWVNNPMVDYIFVEPNFRRQGIGTKLYLVAAEMLKEQNLTLRASQIQSTAAKAVWDKFTKNGNTKKLGKYLILDIL